MKLRHKQETLTVGLTTSLIVYWTNTVSLEVTINVGLSFHWENSAAALSFSWPAYGVSDFWIMRPEVKCWGEQTCTEWQTEKAGQTGCRNKPPKKKQTQWSSEKCLTSCTISFQYQKESVTLGCGRLRQLKNNLLLMPWIMINDIICSKAWVQL